MTLFPIRARLHARDSAPRRRATAIFLAAAFALALAASPSALTSARGASVESTEGRATAGDSQSRAPLVVWNHHVTDFRVPFEDWSPKERAERAAARILAVPTGTGEWAITYRPEEFGQYKGLLFTINGEFAFRLLEGDVDKEAGETLEQASRAAHARLVAVMEARHQQGKWTLVLRGVAWTALLTLALGVGLIGTQRLRRVIQARISTRLAQLRMRAVIAGVRVWPVLGGLRQVFARLIHWSIVGLLLYLWLTFVFHQFPYTQPWGEALGGFLLRVLGRLGWGILASLPDLFVVLLIVALTHAFNRGLGAYFLAVERGEVSVSWLTSEIARATRQILALLTWVFALVVAYPYIPGSDTAAFKGVTVFFGLMVSLGSAGFVNQIMSGLTVIYSRAYRRGEFVRIGDQEGRVRNLGLLATTIEKPGGTEVAIPNAVVTVNTITNFSRGSEGASEILVTSVTIGYDAPWRQVHALMELAAQRTPQLASKPAPFVFQRALSDFYVEYQLHAHLVHCEERTAALSRIHAEIQDAFNEHGVQIMSPHFHAQPERAVVVPRSAWFAQPAPADSGANDLARPPAPA